uniref:Putative peptidoglycan glycosyltransferase FtsW n=1 Tax=Cyanophora paradoxa TaxID=2762 RepID=FTSW_CYAPA|nr:plastid division protein [Cyanophora paradoxa]P48280.1 RecName: Full=Putative peptidoglycan glycosyltransferase FtsW; Short=PGT; AltName: Full=Peptidoglycan polymerase; Short=PG polymerase [Cyanophora paradoxa]AAA81300.1 strong sequence similarity to FtsW, RodA, and SpoV-E [Cyanophora paradoxa]
MQLLYTILKEIADAILFFFIQVFKIFRYFFYPEFKNCSKLATLLRWLTHFWLFFGLMVLISASGFTSYEEHRDVLYYFKRQFVFCLIGIVISNILMHFPLTLLLKYSNIPFFFIFGLTILTLMPNIGISINGARRWIAVYGFLVQPSELIKPFWVLQISKIFGQWEFLTTRTKIFWLIIFLIQIVAVLIQPNLSTASLLGITLWLMGLCANFPWKYLLGTVFVGLSMAITSISLKPYQLSRITSFLDPWKDPRGKGYQLVQSLITIGSGGIFGTGYGISLQKTGYLPIHYTDFIFAVYIEEFGFIGAVSLLLLIIFYFLLVITVILKTNHPVLRLVGCGAIILLMIQTLLNMAVATGIFPTTGLPLPFFSYGGNALLANLINCSFLIRLALETKDRN